MPIPLNRLLENWKRQAHAKYWTSLVDLGFLKACREAIAAENDAAILTCLSDPQYDLIFEHMAENDPRNAQMFKVFLRCSLLGIEIRKAYATDADLKQSLDARLLQGDLTSLAAELSKADSTAIAFLRDLLRLLVLEGDPNESLLQVPLAEEAVGLLLYDEVTDKGVVADLKLALIQLETSDAQGPSRCELYPSPLQALIARDELWRRAESHSGSVAEGRLMAAYPSARCAIRWRISMRGDQPLTPLLQGGSVGGAFALGISNLLSTRGVR